MDDELARRMAQTERVILANKKLKADKRRAMKAKKSSATS